MTITRTGNAPEPGLSKQTWYLIAENQQKDMMEDQIKKAPYLQFLYF